MAFTMPNMAYRTPPPPPGMVTIPDAAERLDLAKPYLYGILRGMGILPVIEPMRVDGSRRAARPRKLLTEAQLRDVRARLKNG